MAMTPYRSLLLLGALGALSANAAEVDTSNWKCESCPFEKDGTAGSVEAGVRGVSDASQRFGNYTGLNEQGASLAAAGNVRYRDADGTFGSLVVDDIVRDAVSLRAQGGREGLFGLRLGYDEIPRYLTETARTPFLGVGGSNLTLPAGFPAADTGAMPLASTLQPVDVEYKRSRLDLGGTWIGTPGWEFRVDARRTKRDGTQKMAGSFFSSASQLVAPLDQTTDDVTASASYVNREFQVQASYLVSNFKNDDPSLTWQNPFNPVNGGTTGQLALPPDNQFHQLQGTFGWQIAPTTRASADVAVGRMTQNEAYLAPTLNASLGQIVLPASSLDGHADTLNAALRLTTLVADSVRLNFSLTRDERNNHTASLTYPQVSTDMFIGAPRANPVYSFTENRAKATIDFRGPAGLKFLGGVQYDAIDRTQQEVDRTRETSVFGRIAGRLTDKVSVELKGAHAERDGSTYNALAWVQPPENALLRKFNLADRRRDTVGLRADVAVSETFSFGLDGNFVYDDYPNSDIGLAYSETRGFGGDASWAVSDDTQLVAFARTDRIRSRQVGSQQFGIPDWSGINEDRADVLGVGVRQAAMDGKLNLGADLSFARSYSDIDMYSGLAGANPFPQAKTSLDSLKLFATYAYSKTITLVGNYWYEHYDARDWRLDGVQPATIPNLLAFGDQPPTYHINVVRLAVRYKF
jgi:MtrB/PioB family decaheme-associated outer membrane protein